MSDSLHDPEVQKYIADSKFGHNDILKEVYEIVRSAVPDASESIKWGMPVFSKEINFCYIKDTPEGVSLGFFSRESLSQIDIKLDGHRKSMCHVTIKSEKDIKKGLFMHILKMLADAKSLLLAAGISALLIR